MMMMMIIIMMTLIVMMINVGNFNFMDNHDNVDDDES
jgi:hypothetical protein